MPETLTTKQFSVNAPPSLELRGISKSFGSTRALDAVELKVHRGEIVGLLGQNGSGKSTLVRTLAGYYAPDRGAQAFVDGEPVEFPLNRSEIGLACVFQDLGLAPKLTVLENLTIGKRVGSTGRQLRINWRAEFREAQSVLETYGVSIPLGQAVHELSLSDQALLAIIRSAEELRRFQHRNGTSRGVLVLDEPTVFLSNREKMFLIELIRKIAKAGASVILVSHDLPTVLEVADRVTVLRDGQVAGHKVVAETTDEQLAELVIGKRLAHVANAANPGSEVERAAETDVLSVTRLMGGRVRGIDLLLKPGEIVGLAGLLGSGVEDVPSLLFGLIPDAHGDIVVDQKRCTAAALSPRTAMDMGIALVPADRGRVGLVGMLSVEENMLLLVARNFFRYGRFRRRAARSEAQKQCENFMVRPADPTVPVASLSGGNQQKVLLAKWCEIGPRVLVLHEPAQGVDVGAREEIFRIVKETAASGTAVIWVTTDFNEMSMIAHRVVVLANGTIAGELTGVEVTKEAISAAVLTWGDLGLHESSGEVFVNETDPNVAAVSDTTMTGEGDL